MTTKVKTGLKIHKWFRWAIHKERGYFGWQMDGQPDFTPVMGIAHDLLEHNPEEEHKLDSPMELMALGALVFIRYEDDRMDIFNRDFFRNNISERIGGLVEEFMDARDNSLPSKLPKPKVKKILPLIAQAEPHFKKAIERIEYDHFASDCDKDDIEMIDWETYALWLTQGYCNAKARYAGVDRDDLCRFFFALDKALPNVETDEEDLTEMDAPAIEVTIDFAPVSGLHHISGEIKFYPKGVGEESYQDEDEDGNPIEGAIEPEYQIIRVDV